MTDLKHLLGGAALIALAAGLAAPAARAQTEDSATDAQTETDAAGDAATAGSQDEGGTGTAQDRLIATVNDTEIREADVTAAMEALPPQAQQMPPEMLLPMVVEQLMLRELILEKAYAENLQDDPDVTAITDAQSEAVEEQAVLSIWLSREIEGRVTDADVTAAYDDFKAANPDAEVTMEAARPQIEQGLAQEAMKAVALELREDAEIVFYDASGSPLPEGGTAEDGAAQN